MREGIFPARIRARFRPRLYTPQMDFPVPQEIVSAPKENSVLIAYFLKNVLLTPSRSCKIAGLYGRGKTGTCNHPRPCTIGCCRADMGPGLNPGDFRAFFRNTVSVSGEYSQVIIYGILLREIKMESLGISVNFAHMCSMKSLRSIGILAIPGCLPAHLCRLYVDFFRHLRCCGQPDSYLNCCCICRNLHPCVRRRRPQGPARRARPDVYEKNRYRCPVYLGRCRHARFADEPHLKRAMSSCPARPLSSGMQRSRGLLTTASTLPTTYR